MIPIELGSILIPYINYVSRALVAASKNPYSAILNHEISYPLAESARAILLDLALAGKKTFQKSSKDCALVGDVHPMNKREMKQTTKQMYLDVPGS